VSSAGLNRPDNLIALGRWLFRNRSWIPVPLAISLIRFARPTPLRLVVGAALALAGLALRLWAVTHIGPRSRTRSTEPPPARVSTGPYRFTNHPLYVGNGILSEGLVVACGAGRPWLPVAFPLLWFIQYGPIMLWESSQFSTMKAEDTQKQSPGTAQGNNTFRAAMSSERRSHQAVSAFAVASIVSGLLRYIRERC
jgi:protein-S-isoprenylcysteine O-methyltransferase Ste14